MLNVSEIKQGDALRTKDVEGLADGRKVVRCDEAKNLYLFCPASKRRRYLTELAAADGTLPGIERD